MAKDNDIPEGLEGRDHLGRFAAGNKWAKLKGIFQSVEELQEAIAEYFETTKLKNGAYKPTLTGLVFHCGFSSLQSFYDYEKDDRYSYTIKRARLFTQSCYETNLYGFAWGGAAFALKNIGKGDWNDEVIQQQNQTITTVNPVVKDSGTPLESKED